MGEFLFSRFEVIDRPRLNQLLEQRRPPGDERDPAGNEEDRVGLTIVLGYPLVEPEPDALLDYQTAFAEPNPRHGYWIDPFLHLRRLTR